MIFRTSAVVLNLGISHHLLLIQHQPIITTIYRCFHVVCIYLLYVCVSVPHLLFAEFMLFKQHGYDSVEEYHARILK